MGVCLFSFCFLFSLLFVYLVYLATSLHIFKSHLCDVETRTEELTEQNGDG